MPDSASNLWRFPHSDIDRMVIRVNCNRRATAARIYGELPRRERAVDIMIAWPEDLKTYGEARWSAIHHALRGGKEI